MKKSSLSVSKRALNIKTLIEREGITQAKLADRLNKEPQNLSRSLRGKVSDKLCCQIAELFPEYRLEWLLGNDDIMLKTDMVGQTIRQMHDTYNATVCVLEAALREVGKCDGVDVPELNDIPEFLLLQAQLQDFAVSLMRNYVNREKSHVWKYLDSISPHY